MSLAAACWWTLIRTVILCLIAWPLIVNIERWLRGLADVHRPRAFALLLAPFLFPELLVGYSYRKPALEFPKWAEVLCGAMLLIRVLPVGVVALLASPPSLVDDGAIHSRRLILQSRPFSPMEWLRLGACYWHGPIRRV